MRFTMLVLAAAAALLTAALATPSRSAKLDFTAQYTGRGAEGIDDIWRGTLNTPDAGVVQLRMERRPNADVHALLFVSYDSVARSFGADVTGRQTDDSTIHLEGHIDVGRGAGTAVDVTMRGQHGAIRLVHR